VCFVTPSSLKLAPCPQPHNIHKLVLFLWDKAAVTWTHQLICIPYTLSKRVASFTFLAFCTGKEVSWVAGVHSTSTERVQPWHLSQTFQVQEKCIRNLNAYCRLSVCSLRSKKWILWGEHVRPSVAYQKRLKLLSNLHQNRFWNYLQNKLPRSVSFVNVCSVSVEFTCTVIRQGILKSNNALVKSMWLSTMYMLCSSITVLFPNRLISFLGHYIR